MEEISRKCEYIIKSKNRNLIWLTYQQVFERFNENVKYTIV